MAVSETTEEFAKKMTQVVSNGFLCVAMTIGDRNGLWKVMTEMTEPKTCKEIAKISGMKEKYLKQWLGAVTSGGIVDVDPTGEKYFLPPHRRAAVTPLAPPCDNFAGHAWGVAVMCEALNSTLKAMVLEDESSKKDEGAKNEDKKETDGGGEDDSGSGMEWFHHITNDFQGSHLLEHIIPANPKLHHDIESGSKILEAGCGSGVSIAMLAEKYPKSTYLGFEMSEEFLKMAKDRAAEKQLPNATFEIQNANELPQDWSGKFDHAFAINVIQHTTPAKSLREMYRVLAPKGTLTIATINSHANVHDNIALPHTPWVYVGNLAYMDEEVVEGSEEASGDEKQTESEESPGWLWGRDNILKAVKAAGFKECEIKEIPGSLLEITYVCSK